MLFESIPPIVLAAIISSIVSGIIVTFNNYRMTSVNNEFQLEREEKQRTWQLEREQQQRIWQEESDQKKWYREKIYDCYKRSIQVLTQMIQEDSEIRFYDDMNNAERITLSKRMNVIKLSSEFFAELTLIKADHPGKDSKEFQDKLNKIQIYVNNNEFITAQVLISEMIENDSRIKN
jgi:hypothetical protein